MFQKFTTLIQRGDKEASAVHWSIRYCACVAAVSHKLRQKHSNNLLEKLVTNFNEPKRNQILQMECTQI